MTFSTKAHNALVAMQAFYTEALAEVISQNEMLAKQLASVSKEMATLREKNNASSGSNPNGE